MNGNIRKISGAEIAHIDREQLERGEVYLYKYNGTWRRVSISRIPDAELSNFAKDVTHLAHCGTERYCLRHSDFDNPEIIVRADAGEMDALMTEARAIMDGQEPISTWTHTEDEGEHDLSTSTAVELSGGKARLDDALAVAKSAQSMMAGRRAAMEMVIAERMAALDMLRQSMNNALSTLRKNVRAVMRVVTMIELYMGIDEELVQIGDGDRASEDEPIVMRQLMLYMDEEAGVTENGGIGWETIEDFDKWLIEEGGLDIVAPERKCMVSLKPRRHDKRYTEDAWANFQMNIPNKDTYFLIRNGDCVWRITTDNLGMQEVLFPKRDQMVELSNILGGIDMDGNAKHYWSDDKQKAEDAMYDFRRRVFFMQGILDRTDCFEPVRGERINVMNLDGEERIRFVYDAEPSLTDGRKTWRNFLRDINGEIKRGSRVVVSSRSHARSELGFKDQSRFFVYYTNEYSIPNFPDAGLYEVDVRESETFIKYNPGDIIYSRSWSEWEEPHERKNRISFIIKPYDSWVVNYDAITVEDIDHYLKSRIDRKDYLTMIPTLKEIRKHKLAELESENAFKLMVKGQVAVDDKTLDDVVHWWKMKTIFKRPISKDDAKAFRMIVAEIKRRTNNPAKS